MMKVIKRDGKIVDFDKKKIKDAIFKSMKYGSGIIKRKVATEIANEIEKEYIKCGVTQSTVLGIENAVYNKLIEKGEKETARAYEGYRAVQTFKRQVNTSDDDILGLVRATNKDSIEENSNKDARVASTQRDLIAGEVSKDIARRRLIPAKFVQAHDEAVFHWHDMDYTISPIFNCCLINLEDMFANGTVINEKMVETPKSFETACTVATQIIAQIASNQYGGCSITIRHLAPYLKATYDKEYNYFINKYNNEELALEEAKNRRDKALKDGIQTIRYQLSTIQSTNGQAPFVTIYLEIEEGHKYEEEMALICEEMIRQRLEGMKNYKGQVIGEAFPYRLGA